MKATDYDGRAYVREQYRTQDNLQVRVRTHEQYGEPKVNFSEWVLDHLAWTGGERVLDVGCGSGAYVDPGLARAGAYIVGDLSLGMVKKLAQPGLARVNLDAQALPLADGTVDVLLANHMLYHVPDQDAAAREFGRVLRPGGRLVAATNSGANMAALRTLSNRALAEMGVAADDVRPDLSFTLENGRALLARHFSQVDRYDLPGALVFPSPEPVIAYLASSRERFEQFLPPGHTWEDVVTVLDRLISAEIAQQGAFRVEKLTGVFICRN